MIGFGKPVDPEEWIMTAGQSFSRFGTAADSEGVLEKVGRDMTGGSHSKDESGLNGGIGL
jgi:hypothetical protein